MLDFTVKDIYPQDPLVLRPRIQRETLNRACVTPFQEDYRVVHPHEPREAKRMYLRSSVCGIHEA